MPYAFTEQGISMLATVLKSKTAIEMSIKIMDAFVSMRRFLSANASLKDVGLRTFGINPMGLDMNIIMMHI